MGSALGVTRDAILNERIPPRLADALLTLAVTLATAGGVVIIAIPVLREQNVRVPSDQLMIVAVLVLLQCATLLLWRVRPVLGFVLAELCQVTIFALAPEVGFQGLPPLLIAYSLGARLPAVRVAILVAVAIMVETLAATVSAAVVGEPALGAGISRLLAVAPAMLFPTVLGISAQTRAATARLLGERAAQERERQVDEAVAEERRRIAGELHDVAAHHLAGMVVQAAAIERMIDRDPEGAKAGAAQLRAQGKQTLNGLRSVVGLLRADGEMATVAGLRDLPELVASTRALGTETTFACSGDTPQLAPIVDAAVYRIAQQALSNAIQHAPGAAIAVRLSVTAEELIMKISNGPAPRRKDAGDGSGGTGMVVMRERASLIGAELVAGPTPSGEWSVRLRLPLAPIPGVAR